jgi:hypothetical protein
MQCLYKGGLACISLLTFTLENFFLLKYNISKGL